METLIQTTGMAVTLGDQRVELRPSGALFWSKQQTLFVADLHLGKTTSFRRGGIPIPAGATFHTVEKLASELTACQAKRLVVLGDLVHATCSWDQELDRCLDSLKKASAQIDVMLIEGNHDRTSRKRMEGSWIQVNQPPFLMEGFCLLHDEVKERKACTQHVECFLAGHLHPCISVGGRSGPRERLRCFHYSHRCLTLPAFGEFTGGKLITRTTGDCVFAVAGNEVLKIS